MYGVNYKYKNYDDIFEDYLLKAAANNLISNDEEYIQDILHGKCIENIFIMDLAIHSEIIHEVYENLTNIHDSLDLNKAHGKNLDHLLEPFILRRNSTYATTKICLEKDINSPDSEIIIPASTKITSIKYPEIEFETLTKAVITTEATKILVESICTIPGPEGNIPAGELNKTTTIINGIKRVYNPESAIGGRNRENDNSYRLRGQAWTSINTQGTYSAFKNAIEEVPGVEDYYIQRKWDGPGTTRIIINPPQKEVLKSVNKAIKDVCAVDEEYTIIEAENKPINININVKINSKGNPPGILEKEETLQQIQKSLKTYIEGNYKPTKGKTGGLTMGEDFIPSRAAAHIINTLPHIKDVTITHPPTTINIDYYQKAICGEIHIETP